MRIPTTTASVSCIARRSVFSTRLDRALKNTVPLNAPAYPRVSLNRYLEPTRLRPLMIGSPLPSHPPGPLLIKLADGTGWNTAFISLGDKKISVVAGPELDGTTILAR